MKTRLYILIMAFVIAGLTSCGEDFLDLQPSTSVSDEQAFSSVESAQTVLNAAYAYVGHYQNHTLSYIAADVMGEDLTVTSGAYGWPTYNWNQYSYMYAQSPVSSPWWTGYANYIWPINYQAIDCVNSIIGHANLLPETSERTELLAQAHAIRGYCYHWLIRLFAGAYNYKPEGPGVILRTDPATATSEHLPRATVAQVYSQIISDLAFAYENVANSSTDYVTKQSAALLLARAYLDMNDFSNAKKHAEAAAGNIFDGSNLMSQEEWGSGFKDHNNEWLWYFNFTPSTCNIYASIPSFYWFAESMEGIEYGGQVDAGAVHDLGNEIWDGYGTIRATKAFVQLFDNNDVRKRFPFYVNEEDGFFTSKFGHRTMMGDAEFPMVRIAEAYLIKAEAEANLGNSATAKNVLNALQLKRGATPTEGTLDKIYLERRKELYGEGHRLFDIKRLRQPLIRSVYPEQWVAIDLPADSPRFMLPLPNNEMLYNTALTENDQNDYWK